jgi:DNA-binding CsgD family transcriptional regulator
VRLRRRAPAGADSVLRFGDVEVDFDRQEATRNGTRIELTGKEFDVLRLLAQNRGRIATRDRLLAEVWGYKHYPTTRTVDNHILRLRQKLEANPSDPRHILSGMARGTSSWGEAGPARHQTLVRGGHVLASSAVAVGRALAGEAVVSAVVDFVATSGRAASRTSSRW